MNMGTQTPFLIRRGFCAKKHPIKSMDDLCRSGGSLVMGSPRYLCKRCSREARPSYRTKYEWENVYEVTLQCGQKLTFRYDCPQEKELWCSWHQHYAKVLEVKHVGKRRRD